MREFRSRRSCLAVPGSSERFMEKAKGLCPDMLFLDLEDAVAPAVKESSRALVVAALHSGGFSCRTLSVRVNGVGTSWFEDDVRIVVGQAGQHVHSVMLPKVESVADITQLDALLASCESALGLATGTIGIEVQIESAKGLMNVEAIAGASPRIEALHFGPADFMASIGMKTLVVGEQPPGYDADAYHYVFMRLLVAARAHDIAVLDGPYLAIPDLDSLRRVSSRVAALGFDGKWAVHPTQIDVINEVFSPSQADFDKAEAILEAYAHATSESGGHRGAVMLGEEMLDEASRKMALVISARGRAAGLHPS